MNLGVDYVILKCYNLIKKMKQKTETFFYLDGKCKYLFTQPLIHGQDMTQCQFSSEVPLVWIIFSFSLTGCCTKAKEASLPYYLSIAGGRWDEFVPFPRALVWREMQTPSSRIWT